MSRHQIPRHARRRLTIAAIAATAIIGTTVTVGIMGIASAGEEDQAGGASAEQCQVEQPPAEEPPAEEPPAEQPPAGEPPAEEPPAEEPPAEEPPAEEPPAEEPPAEEPPAEQPPAEEPPAEEPPAEEPPAQTYGVTAPQAAHPDNPAAADPAAEDPAQGEEEVPPAEGDEQTPPAEDPGAGEGEDPGAGEGEDPGAGEGEVDPNCVGPFPEDFVDINNIEPVDNNVQPGENASTGAFTVDCGTNQNNHNNPDNLIAAPGVRNGAEHTHDYVGNEATDANSNDEVLANAGTTCVNGDQSTYFWPVIRLRDNDPAQDQADPENPHNIGTLLHPASAEITFSGNAQSKVVAMPRFLRASTGDSKAFVERAGSGNDRAQWTCSGFEDRISGTKYPLCPEGSQTKRILEFPSCWDGQNIDSANHKDHIVFPDEATGQCPEGTQAVPALTYTLSYDIPPGQLFALDTFPKELHNPITDHGDFINVMSDELMQQVVDAVNSGQQG